MRTLAAAEHKGGVGWAGSPSVFTDRFVDMNVKVAHHWNYRERAIIPLQARGIEFLPTQWGCGTGQRPWDGINVPALQVFAKRYPGLTWLIFNEPDRVDQANCHPSVAAEAYHLIYSTIKAADPMARIFCCGTSDWPQHWKWVASWMSEYMEVYGVCPPMDGYHIHSYNDFADRFDWQKQAYYLQEFRDMTIDGSWGCYDGGLPVVVSEWGVLSDWNDSSDELQQVAQYLCDTWPWLEAQPWIEKHFWFSTYVEGMSSNLFANRTSDALTIVGEAWQDMAHTEPVVTATPTLTWSPTPTATPMPTITVTPTPEHVWIIFEECTLDCWCRKVTPNP